MRPSPQGRMQVQYDTSQGARHGILLEAEEPPPRKRSPFFCMSAVLACTIIMVVEIQENGWGFQPLFCSDAGCEANPMLGPTARVMQRLGAKDDNLILNEGEWWRLFTCNWLHAGVFHLLMNMTALISLGFKLERTFGLLLIGSLYVLSGLFGATVSVVFLPGVLSVGASASVFGLLGACWADVIVNHCARGKFRDSGAICLFIVTFINVIIGLTPFVDNFMHLGGLFAGLLIGMLLFSRRAVDAQGRKRYTCMQKALSVFSMITIVGTAVVVYRLPRRRIMLSPCQLHDGKCRLFAIRKQIYIFLPAGICFVHFREHCRKENCIVHGVVLLIDEQTFSWVEYA
ncbi:MAG: hypothetical protein SGPRY_004434 [Prymnesium sp.]